MAFRSGTVVAFAFLLVPSESHVVPPCLCITASVDTIANQSAGFSNDS